MSTDKSGPSAKKPTTGAAKSAASPKPAPSSRGRKTKKVEEVTVKMSPPTGVVAATSNDSGTTKASASASQSSGSSHTESATSTPASSAGMPPGAAEPTVVLKPSSDKAPATTNPARDISVTSVPDETTTKKPGVPAPGSAAASGSVPAGPAAKSSVASPKPPVPSPSTAKIDADDGMERASGENTVAVRSSAVKRAAAALAEARSAAKRAAERGVIDPGSVHDKATPTPAAAPPPAPATGSKDSLATAPAVSTSPTSATTTGGPVTATTPEKPKASPFSGLAASARKFGSKVTSSAGAATVGTASATAASSAPPSSPTPVQASTPGVAATAVLPGTATSDTSTRTPAGSTATIGKTPIGTVTAEGPTKTTSEPKGAVSASSGDSVAGASRQVKLVLSHISPWSVAKLALLVSFGIAIMMVVGTFVVWQLLDSMMVFTKINDFFLQIVGEESKLNILQFVELPRVLSLAALLGALTVVIVTALSVVMTFLYNVTAAMLGGVHVTLTDE